MTFFETLMTFDHALFLTINSTHSPLLDFIFQVITWFGSGWVIAPLLIGIVIIATQQHLCKKTILFGIICISLSGLINSQIKRVVSRPRPITYFSQTSEIDSTIEATKSLPTQSVRILGPTLRNRSFPSGHTNTAFAAATFLVLLYGGWFWFSYLIASMVAYSRMYMGVHFFLDTVAGAVLGIAIVMIAYHLYYKKMVLETGVTNDK